MAATERNGRPEQRRSRRNTFQRMLDLEQKNKVNRMQASLTDGAPPARITSTAHGSSSHQQHLELRPSTLKSIGRAMTTPALSLAIPPAKVAFNGATTKYIIRSDGDLIPQEEEESGEGSDVSSICHSPGWEDAASKKRRKQRQKTKEQKRKEMAKAEADAAKQSKSRLSKAPPLSHQRISNQMALAMDRSTSEPVVPGVRNSLDLNGGSKADSSKKDNGGRRSRRGSMELSLKGLSQLKNAIPVPWKSSSASPQTPPTPAKDTPPSSSSMSRSESQPPGGFIGGLKLRQAEDAKVQETIRTVKTSSDVNRGLADNDRDLTKKPPGNDSSNTSIAESFRPMSIYAESVRSPEQWDSIYAQAAQLARNSGTSTKVEDDTTPIMDRNIRKSRKKDYPPTSRYFPLPNDPSSNSSNRDTSAGSTSRTSMRSSSQYSGDIHDQQESSASLGHPGSSPDISADRSVSGGLDRGRGKANNDYVGHQRHQSEDQAVAAFEDQYRVLQAFENQESRDRSASSHRSTTHIRSSSLATPSVSRPGTGHSTSNAAGLESSRTFLNEKYKPHPLQNAPVERPGQRKRSNSAVRGFSQLKNATKSAFSKHSPVPDSPAESFMTASEVPAPSMTKRAPTNGNLSKAEAILGEPICDSPLTHDFAHPNSPTQLSNIGIPHRQPNVRPFHPEPKPLKGASHSRSTTDSSEEVSHGETSYNTTPTASRSESRRDYSPASRDLRSRGGQFDVDKPIQNGFAMMSGGVLDDGASGRDSWCRTAVPIELTEDEERLKTPTAKRSTIDLMSPLPELPRSSQPDLKPSKLASRLQREPSLSRSISSPDLSQDLSFLPALKHQSLARPSKNKGKGKGILGRKAKQPSVSNEQEGLSSPQDLIRPPPIPIPGTKSEGSSPTSPESSQYLQKARLGLPRGPQSPSKPSFPPAQLPPPQAGGPEPIAKFFVICCVCKYYHDMPSKIYECMASPDNVVRDTHLGVSGVISTSVKCPWCAHGMSTSCCAGYAAVVYLREKLH